MIQGWALYLVLMTATRHLHPNVHPRFVQALWYAWGQQDAGIGTDVDAADFAFLHSRLATKMDNGEVTFLPSIQDAWKAFVAKPEAVTCSIHTEHNNDCAECWAALQ